MSWAAPWEWRWSPRSRAPASPPGTWLAARRSGGSTARSWRALWWPPWSPWPPRGCYQAAAHPPPTGPSSPTNQRPLHEMNADRRAGMNLLILFALLIVLDLAAWRWGHD